MRNEKKRALFVMVLLSAHVWHLAASGSGPGTTESAAARNNNDELKNEWSEYRGGAGHNVKQDGDSLVEINEKLKLKPEEVTPGCKNEVADGTRESGA